MKLLIIFCVVAVVALIWIFVRIRRRGGGSSSSERGSESELGFDLPYVVDSQNSEADGDGGPH